LEPAGLSWRGMMARASQNRWVASSPTRPTSRASVLAVWDGELEGIISERDVTRAVAEGADVTTAMVLDFMTGRPYVVHPDDDVAEATALMLEVGVRHLPVVENNELVGMLSIRGIMPRAAPLPRSPRPRCHSPS